MAADIAFVHPGRQRNGKKRERKSKPWHVEMTDVELRWGYRFSKANILFILRLIKENTCQSTQRSNPISAELRVNPQNTVLHQAFIMERLDCLILCTLYSSCTRVILLCTNVIRYVQNVFRYAQNTFRYVQNEFRYVHNVFRYAQNIFRFVHNIFCYVQNVFRYVHNVFCHAQNTFHYVHKYFVLRKRCFVMCTMYFVMCIMYFVMCIM